MNLIQLFKKVVKDYQKNTITFVEQNGIQKLTYEKFYSITRNMAAILQNKGVKKGDYVLIQALNPSDFLIAFWGILLSGAIPAPFPISMDMNKNVEKIEKISNQFDNLFVLVDETFDIMLNNIECKLPEGLHIIKIEKSIGNKESECNIKESDVALVQFSSGSTGAPKGVLLSHENICTNVQALHTHTSLTQKDIIFNWLPLTHDFGLIVMHLFPLSIGCNQVIMDPILFLRNPIKWAEIVTQEKISITAMPNFAMELFLEKFNEQYSETVDLSSLKMIATAGEVVSYQTCCNFNKRLKPYGLKETCITPAYGLAEATVAVTCHKCETKLTYCEINRSLIGIGDKVDFQKKDITIVGSGVPLECNTIRIVDDQRNVLPEKHIGVIELLGPNIMKGYHANEEETRKIIKKDGWLDTGDIGFIYNQELFITGRKKDVIILYGQNFYAYDLENCIKEALKPNIYEVGAISFYDNDSKQEELCLVVECTADYLEELATQIRKILKKEFQINCKKIICVDELPRTSSGKVQRFLLYDMLKYDDKNENNNEVELQQQEEDSESLEDIKNRIIHTLSEILGYTIAEDDTQVPFAELGINSLQSEKLYGILEEKFGVSLPIDVLWNYSTIEKLCQYFLKIKNDEKLSCVFSTEKETVGTGLNDDIAIIAMSCRFPDGNDNPEKFWKFLMKGGDAIDYPDNNRLKLLPNSNLKDIKGGYLDDIDLFDAKFFGISPIEATKMDPQQRLLLELTQEMLENTGIEKTDIDGSRTGVYIGIASHDYSCMITDKQEDLYCCMGNAASIAANRISYYYNLTGPSLAIDTACSSSLVAVHQACQALRLRECDAAICGGVNVILDSGISEIFTASNMLSPEGKCKTFDNNADGYVRGEGCAMIMLRRLEDAKKNKDNILAIIKGSAINQDGKSNGLTAPNGIAQREVILKALETAKMLPNEIDYIEAHGTGTKLGDPIEVNTLNSIFGQDDNRKNVCFLGAVKTNIGHLEAAAGIASLIKGILILNNKDIPSNLHFSKLNQYISLNGDKIKLATKENIQKYGRNIKNIGISSFGFGGTNCHMILQQSDYAEQICHKIQHTGVKKSYWLNIHDNNESVANNMVIEELRKQTNLLEKQNEYMELLITEGTDFFKSRTSDGEKTYNKEGDIKKEDIKTENIKTENIRTENIKTENIKRENIKTENIKTENIRKNLVKIISDITAYPEYELNDHNKLKEELGLDSIMLVQTYEKIRRSYPELKLSDEEMMSCFYRENITLIEAVEFLEQSLRNCEEIEQNKNSKLLHKQETKINDFIEYQGFKEQFEAGRFKPYFKVNTGTLNNLTQIENREMINYSAHNYLGLNGVQEVINKAKEAIEQYGTTMSGSRMISGENILYSKFEKEISDFLGTEDAIVYSSSSLANISVIQTLFGKEDLIIHASYIHDSVIQGCSLAGVEIRSFKNNDIYELEKILQEASNHYRRILVVVEGVDSLYGHICDLPRLIELKKRHGNFLMVDEGNSLGTIGENGKGTGEYYQVASTDVDIWIGSMSKSLASCGGYVAGSKELIQLLKYTSTGIVNCTGLSPANVAAALTSLNIIRKTPALVDQLQKNSGLFLELARQEGLEVKTNAQTPIISIKVKNMDNCLILSEKLFNKGINVKPNVFEEAYLQFLISALHTKEQIMYTVEIIQALWNEF